MSKFKQPNFTKEKIQELLALIDKGLGCGLGEAAGDICIEQAVCTILEPRDVDEDEYGGRPCDEIDHNDHPDCVYYELADFKIILNDSPLWGSNKARALGMRRLGIAQLGTANMKMAQLTKLEKAINNLILPLCRGKIMDLIKGDLNEIDYFDLRQYLDTNFKDPEGIPELFKNRNELASFCEEVVQILKKLKTPGSKFLYLTETKAKKAKKRSRK